MIKRNKVRNSGTNLLKAYVAMKAGDIKEGMKMFASLRHDKGFDEIMEGVAKAMIRMKSMEDSDDTSIDDIADEAAEEMDDSSSSDMSDDDSSSDDDDDDDSSSDDEDDDDDDSSSDDDKSSTGSEDMVEVPASVVKYLKFNQR